MERIGDSYTGVVTNKAHFRYCWHAGHTGDNASRKIRKGERWWVTATCETVCDACYRQAQDAAMPQKIKW